MGMGCKTERGGRDLEVLCVTHTHTHTLTFLLVMKGTISMPPLIGDNFRMV